MASTTATLLSPLDRFRRSMFALPLTAFAALVVVVINEASYDESTSALYDLADRGSARLDVHQLLLQLTEAETGQRGFLLTARPQYLVPYNNAIAGIDETLARLQDVYGGQPSTRLQVKAIESKAQETLSVLSTTLAMHAAGRHEQWRDLLASDIGREKMVELRALTGAFLNEQNTDIRQTRAELFHTLRINRIWVNLMAAVALLSMLLFLRESRASARAQKQLDLSLLTERDRLETEVQRRTDESTELAQHLQSAREDERSRLARELHDELGALMTAAKLDVARLRRNLGLLQPVAEERLASLSSAVDNAISLKRRIIEDLRPSSLSNLGLVAALEILVREFQQRSEIRMHTLLTPADLSAEGQITVYRVVQEALTNAAKHAKASEITVTLGCEEGRVNVSIEDNGAGFDPTLARRSAHGLTGMRYRVKGQGGALTVTSRPGQGTQVVFWLPEMTAG